MSVSFHKGKVLTFFKSFAETLHPIHGYCQMFLIMVLELSFLMFFPDGSQKAIAHTSRSLTHAEHNSNQIEKETLAIVFAIKKFHKMLYGHHFTLITDYKLLSILGSKNGIPVYAANCLQRWTTYYTIGL